MSDQKTWEALMDDTDIVMSMDGDNASFHTKRLAASMHFKDRECRELHAEVKRLRKENRQLMQSNLELLDEQKTIKRDLSLWTAYGHKRGIDVVDLFPRRAGSVG
jgi:hypothetical protein